MNSPPSISLVVDPRLVRVAMAALLCGALGISFSPIFVRLSELEPTATAFHRVFLALPFLMVWSGLEKRKSPDTRQPAEMRDYGVLVLAGAFFAGDLAFWHWSLTLTSVANSTLLANSAPIFVTLAGFLLFGERFSRTFLLGLGLAIAGAVVLMGDSFTVSSPNLLGDGLGLVTAMFYAAYIITVGKLRARFSTATIMVWSSAAAAVILLPITVISGEGMIAPTAYGWTILLGLALVSHTVGQGLIAYALAHLPAAFSSVGLLFQPAAAAVLAWIILGESLSLWQAMGATIILAGIFTARRGSQ